MFKVKIYAEIGETEQGMLLRGRTVRACHILSKIVDIPFAPIVGLQLTMAAKTKAEDPHEFKIRSVEWDMRDSMFYCFCVPEMFDYWSDGKDFIRYLDRDVKDLKAIGFRPA